MTAPEVLSVIAVLATATFVLSLVALPLLRKRIPDAHALSRPLEAYCAGERGAEQVVCVDDNEEALLARLGMIARAKDAIDMATFDLRCDEAGTLVLASLYEAADRGVRVRVLVDGLCSHLSAHPMIRKLQEHEMAEIRFYNPVTLLRPWKINARMHDKFVIADNDLYLIGGRNTSDRFLGKVGERSSIDRELLVYGPSDPHKSASVSKIRKYFCALWESNSARSLEKRNTVPGECKGLCVRRDVSDALDKGRSFLERLLANMLPTRKITLITNSPDAKVKPPLIWHQIRQILLGAHEIVIKTPYMICNDMMYKDLVNASKGARLRIITNSTKTNANIWGASDYLNSMGRIRRMGLNVFEHIDRNSNHTKTILVNGRLSIVGSYNLDMRSTYLDTESMIVVDSDELNSYLSCRIEREVAKSRCLQDCPYLDIFWRARQGVPAAKRLLIGLLRPFVPFVRQLL